MPLVSSVIYESVDEIHALGVGINLLPHATRELDALGVLDALSDVAIQPTTLRYFKIGRAHV